MGEITVKRKMTKEEKAIFLEGYLKARVEDLSCELKISESEAREILINGLVKKLENEKNVT